MNGHRAACSLLSRIVWGPTRISQKDTQRKSVREFSQIGKRVWRDIVPLLAKNSRRNLRCSTPMPNSPSLALWPSSLHFCSLLFSLYLHLLHSPYLFHYSYLCIVFLSFLHTLEFYFFSLCLIYFSFFITIIVFLLSCTILISQALSFSVTRIYARIHYALSHCSAGTKTDRTVSIVPVSIRFGRMQAKKRYIHSTVRSWRDASFESVNLDSDNTEELLKDFEGVRENSFVSLKVRDLLVENWIRLLRRSLIVSTIGI